ncbi:integral membrane sensor signal transduction histidine kinase [Alcanivorax sp. MD8A]|nr:integral membrane sensor signal transduction histidine kinase [Alcanivorax sp. MD8A]
MPVTKRPSSVRGMLLLLLLPAGVALMALAWFIHGTLLERMSREFVESRLKEEVAFLEHRIRESGGAIDSLDAGDYFQEVFHHAFAIASPSQQMVSPESWAPLLKPLFASDKQGGVNIHDASVPEAPPWILAYRRSFMIDGVMIVVIVAENMESLQQSQETLHTWTAVVSVLLMVLLVGSLWIGVTLALRPVEALQSALNRLQSGQISRIDATGPDEFRPLVGQLNQLLDSLEHRLKRSRNALTNLSHSVKTPIAAVRQILQDTGRPLDQELRQAIVSRLDDIDKQLEAKLRRSKFAGAHVGQSAYPVKLARDLLWMLGRLHSEKSFELATNLAEERCWPIDEQDLNEVLGNLLDNAGKWSSRCVELLLEECRDQMIIVVGDDGPGVAGEALKTLGKRGLRLDEQAPGHGLGLAIVFEIVQRYGGEVRCGLGRSGGLTVTVQVPFPNQILSTNKWHDR